jgi:hypothetical protein
VLLLFAAPSLIPYPDASKKSGCLAKLRGTLVLADPRSLGVRGSIGQRPTTIGIPPLDLMT